MAKTSVPNKVDLAGAAAVLDDVLTQLRGVMGISKAVGQAIRQVYDCDAADNIPFDDALIATWGILDNAYGRLGDLRDDLRGIAEGRVEVAHG